MFSENCDLLAVTIKAKPGNAGAVFKGFVVRAKRTIGDTDELLSKSFLIKQINPENYLLKFISSYSCIICSFFQEDLPTYPVTPEPSLMDSQIYR